MSGFRLHSVKTIREAVTPFSHSISVYLQNRAVLNLFFSFFFFTFSLESVCELAGVATFTMSWLALSPRGLFLDPTLTSPRFPWLLRALNDWSSPRGSIKSHAAVGVKGQAGKPFVSFYREKG